MTNPKSNSDLLIVKKGWEKRYKKSWGGGRDFVFEDFLKNYKTKLGPKILDIGSGEGRHVLQLAQTGFDVVGLELTKTGTETANKKLKNRKLHATLVLGDAHNLPFINGYFDSAISIQVFQFNNWKGAELCFAEASRILKKKGLFFLRVKSTSANVPTGNKLIKDHGATYKTPEGNKAHFFTIKEIEQLGKKYGLKVIKEPVDLTPDKKEKGQWNVVFQKI